MAKQKKTIPPAKHYEPKLKINGSFIDVINALVKGKKKPVQPKK